MAAGVYDRATEYVRGLLKEDSGGHDISHVLRVYRTALYLAGDWKDCDLMVVSLAAILHDADDRKLFDTDDYENARRFLMSEGFDASMTEKIIGVIDQVSYSKNRDRRPCTLEAMIVQDADRLDAMGAFGIARTFAYGGRNGRDMKESLRHFSDKLLKLRDLMNLERSKEIADKRHAFMVSYLKEMYDESKETDSQMQDVLSDILSSGL